MARNSAQDEQVGRDVDDVARIELSVDPYRQTLQGELVDYVEHANLLPIVGPSFDDVVGPHMVGRSGKHYKATVVLMVLTAGARSYIFRFPSCISSGEHEEVTPSLAAG